MKLFPLQSVKMKLPKNRCGPRRVVVTGIGAIAPNGVGVDAYCAALRGGVSGVGPITLFEPDELDCRIAAEIKNFHPEEFLSQQELRRVGRSVPLLLAATREALGRAAICWQHRSEEHT